ncbi:MAG: hypothetical protein M1817_003065 [Caeruleum heppii]|nr:MAG: hypothetical protein M1817_003065 [Caeruleum heppii]
MNGNGYRDQDRRERGPARRTPSYGPPPPAKALMESYDDSRNDRTPRQSPPKSSYSRATTLLDSNDPVALHLLVETALTDSEDFDILSIEEVEALKKEYALLTSRIRAVKRKLALESKVRDAAQSLTRLYTKSGRPDSSDGSSQKQRRSLLAARNGSVDPFDQTDDELAVSSRKCEDLANELWKMERRTMAVQGRLLQHTAGVLQLTHRGIFKGSGGLVGAPPLTPESLPYNHGGREDDFDERSLYHTPDQLGSIGPGHGLRGTRGDQGFDGRQPAPSAFQSEDFEAQTKAIALTEQKLDDLNSRMRAIIVRSNPQQGNTIPPVPTDMNGASAPGAKIEAHLDYLEKGLAAVNGQLNGQSSKAKLSVQAAEESLENVNNQLCNLINEANPEQGRQHRPPRQLSGRSLQDQIRDLEEGLDLLQMNVQGALRAADQQQDVQQYETVLTGLWQIIQSGEEEARQRKRQKKQAQQSRGQDPEDSDLSPDEASPTNEVYSLQAFSAKVQWMYARSTSLREQKTILRRQIKQQRQLNSKSDAERDADTSKRKQEIEKLSRALADSEKEANNARQEVMQVMKRLDTARRELAHREQQRGQEDSAASKGLQKAQEEVARLNAALGQMKEEQAASSRRMQGDMEQHESAIQLLQDQLRDTERAKDEAAARDAQSVQLIQAKTQEMQDLESEVVRLQTEVTVARAELDGAYGTRAQRAAEVAGNPAMQKELDEATKRNATLQQEISTLQAANNGTNGLQQRCNALQNELTEVINEYEIMTKQSIEAEKERETMENSIDRLRDRCEAVEAQLSEERVKWMGVKSPGESGKGDHGPVQSTSATVLKNEFKKMMRDTRAENVKALRAEQEERRRLEAIVRSLKKEQAQSGGTSAAIPKSGLSQGVSAS